MSKQSTSTITSVFEQKPWLGWFLFSAIVITVFVVGLFASTIMERRAEAIIAYAPTQKITDFETRNEVWGKNYPREFSSYLKTKESNFKSKFNGNQKTDALAEDPKLVVLWAGYAFSKDYNQPRGHAYAIEDIRNTLRSGGPKTDMDGPLPNTCWSCKSPDVPRMMAQEGVENFYKGKWARGGHEIVNPIGCGDCHDSKTMELRITRPALIEAFQRQGKDIQAASHQEKRSLVCAQCHVEYYFKGKDNYLTFPWDKGDKVEDIEAYYDENKFSDWTHALSKAPMLKAQHPEYETWKHGIHAKRGVSCADCHMPYVSEGGIKYTDHHAQSPLNNINRSCQTCHRQSEQELTNNVYSTQEKVFELRHTAELSLVKAHVEAKAAWENGATEEKMASILQLIRHAQWRWDFSIASHGASFHAGLEMARILGTSIEKSSEARRLLAVYLTELGVKGDVQLPDISTKELAQAYIKLPMDQLKAEKKEFLEKIVPEWDKKAADRHAEWDAAAKKL